jgi:hypothetical protein
MTMGLGKNKSRLGIRALEIGVWTKVSRVAVAIFINYNPASLTQHTLRQ